MLKRTFDIVVSLVALTVFLPLLIVLGLAVRVDSPGRALFRQVRVGRRGQPFQILKFRSMFEQLEPGSQVTVADDLRITRVGRVLRRTKLDELPQLLNVLKGEMSLVGPRPEVPKYVDLYPPTVRDLVLSVRPGLTDEAAIEFVREGDMLARAADPESAYVHEVLPKKLAIYTAYVRNRTFCGDMRILAQTLVRLTRGRRTEI